VLRVPHAAGLAWFKACGAVQAFEPRLTADLFRRRPGQVAEVIGCDEQRAWLLLADAGTPVGALGNPPEAWLAVLPSYAELQRDEAPYADDHVRHGVPDLRLAALPARYHDLIRRDLPLDADEVARLRAFAPKFSDLCAELAAAGVPETVQHDDLHHGNVFDLDGRMRVLDWGDSSISHPFASLFVTFRFLEEVTRLPPDDPWFPRLRDAYLEPWGEGFTETFELAMTVAGLAHGIAWARQRDHLPEEAYADFDRWFAVVLRRALARL